MNYMLILNIFLTVSRPNSIRMQIAFPLNTEIHIKLSILINKPEKHGLGLAIYRHTISQFVNTLLPLGPVTVKLDWFVVLIDSLQSIKVIESVNQNHSLKKLLIEWVVFSLLFAQTIQHQLFELIKSFKLFVLTLHFINRKSLKSFLKLT